MSEVINLTPHAVSLADAEGNVVKTFPPSGQVARVTTTAEVVGELAGFPVSRSRFGDVVGVPAPPRGGRVPCVGAGRASGQPSPVAGRWSRICLLKENKMSDRYQKIRDALAKGPTPGPWRCEHEGCIKAQRDELRARVESDTALLRQALESCDGYVEQLELIVYSPDDTGTHDVRAKAQSTIAILRNRLARAAGDLEGRHDTRSF